MDVNTHTVHQQTNKFQHAVSKTFTFLKTVYFINLLSLILIAELILPSYKLYFSYVLTTRKSLERGTSKDIFKIKTDLKVEGMQEVLVVINSVKVEIKITQITPNSHFMTFCDSIRVTKL